MASVVNMCNSALNLLGASTISSLTEDTKNARLCNQRFTPIRDRVFRSHNWNCLIKRVQLAQDYASFLPISVRDALTKIRDASALQQTIRCRNPVPLRRMVPVRYPSLNALHLIQCNLRRLGRNER